MQEKSTQYVDYFLSRLKSALKMSSDAELASFLGLSPQAISSWRSRNTINFDIIIAKCVDVDLNWLVRGNTNTQNADIISEAPLKENMRPHLRPHSDQGGGTIGENEGAHSLDGGPPLDDKSLKAKPPGIECALCVQKNLTIDALQKLSSVQQKTIDLLNARVNDLESKDKDDGQKKEGRLIWMSAIR